MRSSVADQKKLSEDYQKHGWTLKWDFVPPDTRRNCFWYGGTYATAKGKYKGHDWFVEFACIGDVIFDYYDKDGEWKTCGKDKGNNGNRDDIKGYIKTDYDLSRALADCYPDAGRLELDYGNWCQPIIYMDGEMIDDGTGGDWGDNDDIILAVQTFDELTELLDEDLEKFL